MHLSYFFKRGINDPRFFVICFLLIISCTSSDVKRINNLNGNRIEVIGHGGMGNMSLFNTTPTNTMRGIVKAIDQEQADGVEADLQMTLDSVLVLVHDARLKQETSCEGYVIDHTYEYLKGCNHKKSILDIGNDEYPLISLNDVLGYLGSQPEKKTLVLDVKLYNRDVPRQQYIHCFARALQNSLKDYEGNVLIESTDTDFLQVLNYLYPSAKLFVYVPSYKDAINALSAHKNILYGITIRYNAITADEVADLHLKGMRVALWGAGGRFSCADAIGKSPDYIQTEDIEVAKKKMKDR